MSYTPLFVHPLTIIAIAYNFIASKEIEGTEYKTEL